MGSPESENRGGVAQEIQKQTNADIFEIELVTPYSTDYNTVLMQAQQAQHNQDRPEIKGTIDDFDQYDTIILGYPNRWASIPMPIATLLEQYDLSEKTILPFCSHGGGNVFLVHGDTGKIEPLYYTFTNFKVDYLKTLSAVETKAGVYYLEENTDGYMEMFNLYLLPRESGAYTPSYQQELLGDVDGDGEVTVVDATITQRYSVKRIDFTEAQINVADVDGDGEVSAIDATLIQRFSTYIPVPYPINEYIKIA